MVECYWIELRCYKNLDTAIEVRLQLNRTDQISKICRKLYEKFAIQTTQLTRLWTWDGSLKLLNPTETIEEAGLKTQQIVLLETQISGHWLPKKEIAEYLRDLDDMYSKFQRPPVSKPKKSYMESKSVSADTETTDLETSDLSDSFKKITVDVDHGITRNSGLCGLVNLGYTCYMNSVLQCLSHCPPLTKYFLESRHEEEINRSNPMGSNGEIAKAYGELVHELWSGENQYIRPINLKTQVSRFNKEYGSWMQHDAQEFLSFLLDGLHEDLSRPHKNSKYNNEQKNNRIINSTDKIKNDSIIVETFYGLLKSRVICPTCEKLSVTYDPFLTLSLPLPLHKNRNVTVHFIPNEASKTISSYMIAVPYKGQFTDLLVGVSHKTGVRENCLIPAEVTDYHIQRIFTQDDKISLLNKNDEIYVYELSEISNDTKHYAIIIACFWNRKKSKEEICVKYGFGIPLLLTFQKNILSQGKIGLCILKYIKERFKFVDETIPEMYILDLNDKNFANFIELEFNDDGICKNDVMDLLELNNSLRIFERKMLYVNVPLTGKESFFEGMSDDKSEEVKMRRFNKNIDIYDCLDMFTSFEKLGEDNAWLCPACKSRQRATKKFDIWTTPKVLILHLKLFSYSGLGVKLEEPVDFPLTGLDLRRYLANPEETASRYDLVGVIQHVGRQAVTGHYTASCRTSINPAVWHLFDDSNVRRLVSGQLNSPNAYVLFYLRVDNET